ncbi:HET-domain-containing protein [Eremomyces bilateralis CBS 781.70]|uniref:HET-domain-containing protein n=1 Tax=Eremomyces bilateralis CBS 781.70 TaxID=1392243 RepID=A0A6G1G0W9_9PEZI|nr:HET-domain-containing protein [Eremomyces bilateralis CBS 781.70]KAF1811755.1 HET-domain-containing protein [Eremomyces bilateralis CBS 781.70]
MRLLHTDTLELHYFPRDAPPYAILSHTWETEELSLQEIGPKSKGTRGYKKIAMAAATARADNLDYIWVDTCCIDKTSSAELSEAINSMFQWYQNASVCYAYLFDVVPNHHDSVASINPRVRESKWFTRGWTLQELIAPSDVIFYAQDWTELGTKSSLRTVISQITRIPELVLLGKSIKDYSIAQRMSWASQRKTTRTEDMAYCLMGLFEITMPMLYGEGMQAFIRLQEEIMKKSDDQTLFAWTSAALSVQYRFGCGLLAPVPRFFETCAGITTFAMTNKGLSIRLPKLATGLLKEHP